MMKKRLSRRSQRDANRRISVQRYEHKRVAFKTIQNHFAFALRKRFSALTQLSRIGPKSSRVQVRNRCVLTGRSRGVYNYFKISRIMIRELTSKGLLPGVKKAS